MLVCGDTLFFGGLKRIMNPSRDVQNNKNYSANNSDGLTLAVSCPGQKKMKQQGARQIKQINRICREIVSAIQ